MDRALRVPLTPIGLVGLFIALVAVGLAILGVTPYTNTLRFPRTHLPEEGATAIYVGTMFVPIGLGLFAMMLGRLTTRIVERSQGTKAGEGPAVFAILIGLVAVVLGSVSTFVVFVHPKL